MPYSYSPAGLALTKSFEHLDLNAYPDGGGVWSIGYGHTGEVNGQPVCEGMSITLNEAGALLQQDVQDAVVCVNRAIKEGIIITQSQFDAMVDFAFNAGRGAFQRSTLLRLVNLGEPHLAATQFLLWVHDSKGNIEPGLVRRRTAEAEMFSA